MKIIITIIITAMIIVSIFLRCIEILISTFQFMFIEGHKTLKYEYYEFIRCLNSTWKDEEKGAQ